LILLGASGRGWERTITYDSGFRESIDDIDDAESVACHSGPVLAMHCDQAKTCREWPGKTDDVSFKNIKPDVLAGVNDAMSVQLPVRPGEYCLLDEGSIVTHFKPTAYVESL
jgi:hypothetical protein